MNGLPAPPPEYWTSVPWWGWLGFCVLALLITVVLGPYMVARSRGAPSAMASREDRITRREVAADAERDTELARLRLDYANGWNKARGMELLAHGLWHDLRNATQKGNNLLFLLQRVIRGEVRSETGLELLREYEPMPLPGAMPKLADVSDVTADQHRY